jgi:hypothetical protein
MILNRWFLNQSQIVSSPPAGGSEDRLCIPTDSVFGQQRQLPNLKGEADGRQRPKRRLPWSQRGRRRSAEPCMTHFRFFDLGKEPCPTRACLFAGRFTAAPKKNGKNQARSIDSAGSLDRIRLNASRSRSSLNDSGVLGQVLESPFKRVPRALKGLRYGVFLQAGGAQRRIRAPFGVGGGVSRRPARWSGWGSPCFFSRPRC